MSGSVSRRPLAARYGYQYLKGVWVEEKGELLRGKKKRGIMSSQPKEQHLTVRRQTVCRLEQEVGSP